MSMTAELQPKSDLRTPANPSIWTRNITVSSSAQLLLFLTALALTAFFGKSAMKITSAYQLQQHAPCDIEYRYHQGK
jgi:hypothetical protein